MPQDPCDADHPHDAGPPVPAPPVAVPEGPAGWDARYTEQDQLWSGRPNEVLVTEVAGLTPGLALDVGCGEGADAVWLAEQGWTTTGLDVSRVAVERGATAAAERGVTVTWVASALVDAALVDGALPAGAFDLVSLHYPALPHTPDDAAITALLGLVAPGGTLLVVGHAFPEDTSTLPVDPAIYVQPPDVAARLGADWIVEVNEARRRTTPLHGPRGAASEGTAGPHVPGPGTDGSPHDGSPHDGSPHDGSPHDGSPHDGPPHDGPEVGSHDHGSQAQGRAHTHDVVLRARRRVR